MQDPDRRAGACPPPKSIRPFRGLYFDPHRAGSADLLTAPPADLITPAMQQALCLRSPYNVVRLHSGPDLPGDTIDDNRHTRARRALLDWQRSGVLRREAEPTFYLYEQEFEEAGRSWHRLALIALGLLPEGPPPSSASPRDERCRLISACHANFTPIAMLVRDDEGALYDLLDRMHYDADDQRAEFRDGGGVLHRFKAIHGAAYAEAAALAVDGRPAIVVDGQAHHDAAHRHREWARRENPDFGPESPENFALMAFLSSRDPSLQALASGSGPAGLQPSLLSGLVINKIDGETL